MTRKVKRVDAGLFAVREKRLLPNDGPHYSPYAKHVYRQLRLSTNVRGSSGRPFG